MAAHLPDAERYVTLYIDLSACQSSAEFYTRVYRQLANRLSRRAAATVAPPATADVYMVESLLYEFGDRRVIWLLDEFDGLRAADFGDDFMTQLRALAGVWDYELGYVTASYWDLYRLGLFIGLPPTSPFYNIFYPTPIYLPGLGQGELDDLVRVPARRVGVAADDEDVALVRHVAGTLPFFVQATAAVWLTRKSAGRRAEPGQIIPALASEMGPYFEQWWRVFSDVERDTLAAVAREQPAERLPYSAEEVAAALRRMKNYGVLASTGDHLWIDSALFAHWLREHTARSRHLSF
jgi:hypothetical protein